MLCEQDSAMISVAELVNGVDQCGDVVWIDVRRDPVSEVENVAAAAAVALQNSTHLRAHAIRSSVQRGGIEVALQRYTIAHAPPRCADIGGPVDAEGIGAARGHRLEPLAAVFGEQNYRDTPAVILARQATHDVTHVTQ